MPSTRSLKGVFFILSFCPAPLMPATQDEQNSLNLTPEHEEFLIEEA